MICLANPLFADKPWKKKNRADIHSCSSSSSSSSCSCRGPAGPEGPEGPQGPPGPPGEIDTFISAVAHTGESQSVPPNTAVNFNLVTASSGGVTFTPGTGLFTVTDAGSYEITFGARFSSLVANNPIISLRINGSESGESRLCVNPGTQAWATMSLIYTVPANTTIEVINSPGNGSANIDLLETFTCCGGTTVAFVTIKQIKAA